MFMVGRRRLDGRIILYSRKLIAAELISRK
jgi:hypothetical protein